MLNNISWSLYWTAIGVTLFFYYAIVAFKYYSLELKQILSGKGNPLFNKRVNDSLETSYQQNTSPMAQFKEEIDMILIEARDKNLIKEEILYAVQLLLKKSQIDISGKSSINNYIQTECSNNCSIHLDEEELARLWVN